MSQNFPKLFSLFDSKKYNRLNRKSIVLQKRAKRNIQSFAAKNGSHINFLPALSNGNILSANMLFNQFQVYVRRKILQFVFTS